ncbi:MAG: hypothetical protein NT103_08035 [Campylobacterales bacterium]|nr:hypothetical protein [Campylobacterales bacterium]
MTKSGTINTNKLMAAAISSGITDPVELANFMGQMQVESSGFTQMVEKTNYSAQGLLNTFGPKTDSHGVWHDGRNGLTTLAEAQSVVSKGQKK